MPVTHWTSPGRLWAEGQLVKPVFSASKRKADECHDESIADDTQVLLNQPGVKRQCRFATSNMVHFEIHPHNAMDEAMPDDENSQHALASRLTVDTSLGVPATTVPAPMISPSVPDITTNNNSTNQHAQYHAAGAVQPPAHPLPSMCSYYSVVPPTSAPLVSSTPHNSVASMVDESGDNLSDERDDEDMDTITMDTDFVPNQQQYHSSSYGMNYAPTNIACPQELSNNTTLHAAAAQPLAHHTRRW